MVASTARDNGIGIAPEYYDRIFEMFRRLRTRDEYEGTGVGLTVGKKIIDRCGAGLGGVDARPGLDVLLHPAGRHRLCDGT